ncbi:hypothetical protein [Arsukibacterium sp.]|uniref:hypothetical protein n=1 Tax=Arsukibacterium sp. TaxID=1977258 RepID=UPI001BD5EB8F|nr:hypothetical protein [Arsukibacterium sp.]
MSPTPKFTLWREQRIILAKANGSWSRFTAEDYTSQFKALAMPLIGEDWAHLVYLDNWQLGAPDIEPVVQDLVRWCLQSGLRYTAQVYCPNMVKQYQLNRMIIDSTSLFEKRVYPDQQDAFAWLASLGYHSQCQNLLQGG